jgi:5'-3' exonuclease
MYRKKAAQCLAQGKKSEARECFTRCIDVTQKMAHDVIRALHDVGVDVLIAPYEADAQLTCLNKLNIAQIVITEDSDLILFGCKKVSANPNLIIGLGFISNLIFIFAGPVQTGLERQWELIGSGKN